MQTAQTKMKIRKLHARVLMGLLALGFLLAPLASSASQAVFQVRMDWKYKLYEITPYLGTTLTTGGYYISGYTTTLSPFHVTTTSTTTSTTYTNPPTSTVTNMNVNVWPISTTRTGVTSYVPPGTGPPGLGTTWPSACATGSYCLLGSIGTTTTAPPAVYLPSWAATAQGPASFHPTTTSTTTHTTPVSGATSMNVHLASSTWSAPSTWVVTSSYHIPGYPTATRTYSMYNLMGYFYPNNPYAATTTTTVYGVTSTTKSGNNYAFDRAGKMVITPGVNRFGGTMRIFFGPDYNYHGLAVALGGSGYADYRWNAIRARSNAGTGTGGAFGPNAPYRNSRGYASSDPQSLGQAQSYGSTQQTHTAFTTGGGLPLKYQFWAFSTLVPFSTGMAVITQQEAPDTTVATWTGSDNRTPAGMSGMISLVQPLQFHNYRESVGGGAVLSPYHTAWMRRVQITLLPEPGAVALLGIGIVAMGGLYRARKK